MLAIYIDAGHSSSGNLRRGWIITNDNGEFVDFIDEGYEGSAALAHGGYGNCTPTSKLEVKPSVYQDAYRHSYGHVGKTIKNETKLLRDSRRKR